MIAWNEVDTSWPARCRRPPGEGRAGRRRGTPAGPPRRRRRGSWRRSRRRTPRRRTRRRGRRPRRPRRGRAADLQGHDWHRRAEGAGTHGRGRATHGAICGGSGREIRRRRSRKWHRGRERGGLKSSGRRWGRRWGRCVEGAQAERAPA